MLSDKDLARLANLLEVPLVIQDILDGREDLTGEIQYGMHEVLSNDQPDSALLSIALSARRIAQRFLPLFTNLAVMRMECDRILEDYAELWLDHARKRPIDNNLLIDTLSDIPEDLESLAELLEINAALLKKKHIDAARLCSLLAAQARAQALIADTFVDMMDRQPAQSLQDNTPPAGRSRYSGNVIPFPYYARA